MSTKSIIFAYDNKSLSNTSSLNRTMLKFRKTPEQSVNRNNARRKTFSRKSKIASSTDTADHDQYLTQLLMTDSLTLDDLSTSILTSYLHINNLYACKSKTAFNQGINSVNSNNPHILNYHLNFLNTNLLKLPGYLHFIRHHSIHPHTQLKATRLFKYEHIPPQTIIFKQYDFTSKFYIIVKGTVSIRIRERINQFSPLGEVVKLSDGMCFGERASIYDNRRSATVFAIDDLHCFTLEKENFIGTLGKSVIEAERHRKEFLMKTIPFLKTIEASQVNDFIKNYVRPMFYNRNEVIYEEGEQCGLLYVVYEGEAKIMTDIRKPFISVLPEMSMMMMKMLKKQGGLDYKAICKEGLVNRAMNSALNGNGQVTKRQEIDMSNLTTIIKISIGDIGGSEITAGMSHMRYTMVSTEDFTSVLTIDLLRCQDHCETICHTLLPIYKTKEEIIAQKVKMLKKTSVPLNSKIRKVLLGEKTNGNHSHLPLQMSASSAELSLNTSNTQGVFDINKAGFIKQNQSNRALFIACERKRLRKLVNEHISSEIQGVLNKHLEGKMKERRQKKDVKVKVKNCINRSMSFGSVRKFKGRDSSNKRRRGENGYINMMKDITELNKKNDEGKEEKTNQSALTFFLSQVKGDNRKMKIKMKNRNKMVKYKSMCPIKNEEIKGMIMHMHTPNYSSLPSSACSSSFMKKQQWTPSKLQVHINNCVSPMHTQSKNKDNTMVMKGTQTYHNFNNRNDYSVHQIHNSFNEPILLYGTGNYDLPLASLCKSYS